MVISHDLDTMLLDAENGFCQFDEDYPCSQCFVEYICINPKILLYGKD